LLDIKPESKHQLLTEENLDELGAGLEHTPWKSFKMFCTADWFSKL
jgi:hypothetical protein